MDSNTERAEARLARADIHAEWESVYRTPENEAFYERVFDRIVDLLQAPPGTRVLDVGCGSGAHAMRLARRGLRVDAVDLAEPVVANARSTVAAAGLGERITVRQANLRSLPAADGSYPIVLCWGVLMHVPDILGATAELARVVAPGGRLVVSEGNARSLEARAMGLIRRAARRPAGRRVPEGIEFWKDGSGGRLLVRVADVGWLQRRFAALGLPCTARLPGQFTEAYCKLPRALATAAHRLNDLWFPRGAPALASGNILIFTKRAAVV